MRKFNRKRGMAMEMAIFVLVVFLALSMLIVTFIAISTNHKNKELKAVTRAVEVNSIGESYLSSISQGEAFVDWQSGLEDGYTATETAWVAGEKEGLEMLLLDGNGKQALYIKLVETDTGYTVLEWK